MIWDNQPRRLLRQPLHDDHFLRALQSTTHAAEAGVFYRTDSINSMSFLSNSLTSCETSMPRALARAVR